MNGSGVRIRILALELIIATSRKCDFAFISYGLSAILTRETKLIWSRDFFIFFAKDAFFLGNAASAAQFIVEFNEY